MSICALFRGVERAFCARSSWTAASQETCPLREAHAPGMQIFEITESCHGESSSSPWKFWRRLSSRSRQDHKSSHRKERPTIVLLDKTDPTQTGGELNNDLRSSLNGQSTARSLPDVVEKAQGIPRFSTNGVPPPKPPRLFLFRTPSTDLTTCLQNFSTVASLSHDITENRKNIWSAVPYQGHQTLTYRLAIMVAKKKLNIHIVQHTCLFQLVYQREWVESLSHQLCNTVHDQLLPGYFPFITGFPSWSAISFHLGSFYFWLPDRVIMTLRNAGVGKIRG
uniref:Uncharacterized protein n=1 Tax=Biomphalaria glabrata TaxID=6526 RepID=A0A2C9LWG2_BIOGL